MATTRRTLLSELENGAICGRAMTCIKLYIPAGVALEGGDGTEMWSPNQMIAFLHIEKTGLPIRTLDGK